MFNAIAYVIPLLYDVLTIIWKVDDEIDNDIYIIVSTLRNEEL